MDIASRLLLFLEVIEQGSFARASAQRNINRSAVSKQISNLEDELGVRLLNRSTRSLSLTPAGSEMLGRAKQLRELLSDTQRQAQNYHTEPMGRLKIASSTLFGKQFIHQAAIEFRQKYPQVDIELVLEDRMVDLISEGYDLGFRVGAPQISNLVAQNIARNRLLIVAAPSFLEKYGQPQTVSELEALPAVAYSSPGLVFDKIKYQNDDGEDCLIDMNIVYRVNEVQMMIESALSGEMYTLTTAQMIDDEVLDGRLVPIMTHLKLQDYGYFYAIYPHRSPPTKTKLFLDIVKDKVGRDIPIWESYIPGFDKMYGVSK